MVAGIVAGQLRGLSLSDCARLATAFSLDALERGESGVSSHAAIEAFMQKVTIS
jgi:1-phosphofructokinase